MNRTSAPNTPFASVLLPDCAKLIIGKDAFPRPFARFGLGHSPDDRRTEIIAPRGMPVHYLTNNSKGSISHHSAIGIFDAVEPAAALRLLCNYPAKNTGGRLVLNLVSVSYAAAIRSSRASWKWSPTT